MTTFFSLRSALSLFAAAGALFVASPPASAIEFGLPAACTLGQDCFVQQFPDMDPGKQAASDPYCGSATYDGHKGLDLRILSMKDVERGVAVTAMADGKVLRRRDGEPDRLVTSEADREAVDGKECGNGVVVDHGDGYEVQYCHMKERSIAVRPGDTVKRGDRLGDVGASGMAQFPHVHVTVRKDKVDIDASTGRALTEGCLTDASAAQPLYAPDIMPGLGHGEATILAAGLAGKAIEHNLLNVEGPPPTATTQSDGTVAWAWLINLRGGDSVNIKLVSEDGEVLFEREGEPVERNKASYSAFAGKKKSPPQGKMTVEVAVMRDGKPVLEKTVPVTVE